MTTPDPTATEDVWKRIDEIIDTRLARSVPASEVVRCLAAMPTDRRNAWFEACREKGPAAADRSLIRKPCKGEPRWMRSAETK